MSDMLALPIKQPISVWNKPIRAEWRGLFRSLTRIVGQALTGKWTSLADEVAGMVASLGVHTSVEERAWLLIRRALVQSMFELLDEHRVEPSDTDELSALAEELDAALGAAELEITSRFLERPGELSIIEDIQPLLRRWLQLGGASVATCRTLPPRLRSYFVHALNIEWRRNRRDYEPILAALDTPFARASEREHAWQENAALLRRGVNEPMFAESFGLEQVYIPRRAASLPPRRAAAPASRDARSRRRRVVRLSEYMRAWLDTADREDAVRVISGGPGSGKSSFVRMLAAELTETLSTHVLYVPLFELELGEHLRHSLDAFVKRKGLPLTGLLDPNEGEDWCLLIFDGLDELSIRGKLGSDAALAFVRQVERAVGDMNRSRCRLQVLITGRELAVQVTEREFRHAGQIVHLLPYYVPAEERDRYHDPDELLIEDHRDSWWAKFGWATGKDDMGSLPETLRHQDLREITSEPLLCYLVALSYCSQRLDFSRTDIHLNEIYGDLSSSVYHRGYDGRRRHPGVQHLSEAVFIEILEEIGLAAWHGSGRTATLSEIRSYCTRSPRLARLIGEFEKDAEAGVTGLMLAFYFRQGATTELGENTFEFTHKSFAEYLTARRIVRAAARIAARVMSGESGDEDGWTEADACKYWITMCGPSALDPDIVRFIRGEVARNAEHAPGWQAVLAKMVTRAVSHGMPMELMPRIAFQREVERARNAEIGLFVVLDACARTSGATTDISAAPPGALAAWLRSVHGGDPQSYHAVLLDALAHLDLGGQSMFTLDLRGADLSRANLHDVILTWALLSQACLAGADLEHAQLRGCDLSESDLRGAHLAGALLIDACMARARMAGAVLRHADLSWARLTGANLTDVDAKAAKFCGANLAGACLAGADLEHADLSDACLRDADLSGAQLGAAYLNGADLRGADLSGADLSGAKLGAAVLTRIKHSSSTVWPAGFRRPA